MALRASCLEPPSQFTCHLSTCLTLTLAPTRSLQSLASHAGIALPAASLPPGALLALLAAPGFLIKQVTNLEQLRSSSERLIEWELKKEGRKAR